MTTETYTQRGGCPLCGSPECDTAGTTDTTTWVVCRSCGVEYVLEDVEAKLEELRR